MGDKAIEGEWIVLKDPVGVCSHCVNNKACEEIRKQIGKCTEARYRFRCPIEVFVPPEEAKP